MTETTRHVRPRPAPDGGFDRRLIAPMVLGAVLNPVNSSIIAVSLVPIGVAFGAPPARTAWLVSALYLATAVGQPVVGRLVDLYGPRRLYLAGTGLAGVAGVLGTLAPDLGVLIAARVLLGFGTCAGYPAAMHLLRGEAIRTGQDRPAGVLTVLAVAGQTTAAVGPTLGGLLIGLGGWRTTFAVNIPLAAACLVLGALRLPKAPRMSGPPSSSGPASGARRLDPAGMALFAAALVTLLLFLMDLRAAHWYLPLLAAVAATALTARELRTPEPFLDLRVLGGNLPLLATYGRTVLATTISYCFLYGYTQWLEQGRGLSASQAGLILLPLFLTAIGVSAATGRRPGIRGKLLVGAAVQAVACALLFTLGAGSPVWLLVAVSLLVGVPQGLTSLALQNAVYHQAEPARIGSSAGLLRTFTYLGAIVAAAAGAAVFPHRADTAGLHHLAVGMLVVALLLLMTIPPDRSLRRVAAPEPPA
ncbi:MFS transporter [Streptomyces sp. NPDC093085]|uniref:MFS transporter n=1 Tax=Streptomyces sp. NPDC093085 TaxID=3155068 RepID=UPI003420A7EB